MNPRPNRVKLIVAVLLFLSLGLLLSNFAGRVSHAQGGQVQVTAADPSSTAQGTINLNVKVNGKGFKNGAKAKWYVAGTTDPGGVTVNSTTFVNANELTANITVSDTASIANFDIYVANSDGRGGKGTELFAVTSSAGNNAGGCTLQPLPAGISLAGSLNYVTGGGPAAYGPGFGITIRSQQMSLNGQNVLVVGVGTPAGTGKLEVFFIDPVSGQVLDNTIIGSGTSPQPHLTVNYGAGTRSLAVGDVNADGLPDFVAGSSTTGSANAEVGSLSPAGVVSYQVYPLTFPANASGIGWGLAMGDLNGDGQDEIAAGATGGSGTLGQVSIFSFNGSGFTNTQNILSPLPNAKKDENFGNAVAIADVTGTGARDLIVGAPNTLINKATGAGRVFVFPGGPVNAANYLTFTTGGKNDNYGNKVGGGDVNGDTYSDLLAATAWNGTTKAQTYHGMVFNGQAANSVLLPVSGLNGGWSTTEPGIGDVNGDGLADVLVGAPNAESAPICGGVAYLYLSNGLGSPLANRLMLTNPVLESGGSAFQAFGWSSAMGGSGSRLFFVGDNGLDLGGSPAGQVYIFKVN